MENIVIIGGGFAGLQLVKHLDKSRFNVRLIDRNNYNYFPGHCQTSVDEFFRFSQKCVTGGT